MLAGVSPAVLESDYVTSICVNIHKASDLEPAGCCCAPDFVVRLWPSPWGSGVGGNEEPWLWGNPCSAVTEPARLRDVARSEGEGGSGMVADFDESHIFLCKDETKKIMLEVSS